MQDTTVKGIRPKPHPDQTGHDPNRGGEGGGEAAHHAPAGRPIPLVIDPEFEALIPPLSDEELAQLTANLLADGCREPLWVWPRDGDGQPPVLLDGHHCHAICRAHGLAFTLAPVPTVRTREEALIWMLSRQIGRRNLKRFTRIELMPKLAGLIATRAKAQQGGRTDLFQNSGRGRSPIHTDREVAKLAGVSHDTLHKVRRLVEKADEPTKTALRQGQRSIHAAYQGLARRAESRRKPGNTRSTAPSPQAAEAPEEVPAEPYSPRQLAERLIGLAEAMLRGLAAWHQRHPQDFTVNAFLMEKHIGEVKRYFERERREMGEGATAVATPQAAVHAQGGAGAEGAEAKKRPAGRGVIPVHAGPDAAPQPPGDTGHAPPSTR
jgi:hypothetical protein